MKEFESFDSEPTPERYPRKNILWQYGITRPLNRLELDFLVEETSVTIHTTDDDEFVLGGGGHLYLGEVWGSDFVSRSPFPSAGIVVRRRPSMKDADAQGIEIALELIEGEGDEAIATPVDVSLWEDDRKRIEVAVSILGGERTI